MPRYLVLYKFILCYVCLEKSNLEVAEENHSRPPILCETIPDPQNRVYNPKPNPPVEVAEGIKITPIWPAAQDYWGPCISRHPHAMQLHLMRSYRGMTPEEQAILL